MNTHVSPHVPLRVLLLGVVVATSAARHASAQSPNDLELRLVPITQGNRVSAFADLTDKFHRTPVYEAAQLCGVDIASPDHPLVICSLKRQRAFYLFYNVVTNLSDAKDGLDQEAPLADPYLIQRVRRTVTDFPRDGEPTSKVDYLVEAMKTSDGVSKRPDQHFGSFGLGAFARREIVKEFEVGIGEVKGHASGAAWPFDSGVLYESIQKYQAEPAAYDQCRFIRSTKWTLTLQLDRHGNYALNCPELGIEIVHRVPSDFVTLNLPPHGVDNDGLHAEPVKVDPASEKVVLNEGSGVLDLRLGDSRLDDVKQTLGEPIRVDDVSRNANNYSFGNGLKFNINNDGPINTIMTLPGFRGRTSKGIRHGDTREKVNEVYGQAVGKASRSAQMHDGAMFWFSEDGKVTKIVLVRRVTESQPDN